MSAVLPAWVSGHDGPHIYVSLTDGEIAYAKRVTPDVVALDYDAHDMLMGIEIILPDEKDESVSGLWLSDEQLAALADRAYKVSGHGSPGGPLADLDPRPDADVWYQEGYRYGVDVGVHVVLMDLLQIEADDIGEWVEEHRSKDPADD